MRGHRNSRNALGVWTRIFPYLGIAFLFAINFYWIYNSNRSHEGTHSKINSAVKEKEEAHKSFEEREASLSETIERLDTKERELEAMEEALQNEAQELRGLISELSKKVDLMNERSGSSNDKNKETEKSEEPKESKPSKKILKKLKSDDPPKKNPKLEVEGDDYNEVVSVDPNDVVSKKGDKPHVGQDPVDDERKPMSLDEFNEIDIEKELQALSDKQEILTLANDWMTTKIQQVQNPTNCEDAKWNYCRIYNNCGGGCVIHQIAYCFLIGLAKNRITVVGDGWRYLRECESSGWDCAFEPVTNCTAYIPKHLDNAPAVLNGAKDEHKAWSVDLFSRGAGARFVKWAASDGFHTNTPFYLPTELESIRNIHGDSRVWLVGHVEKYLLRLNKAKKSELMRRVGDLREKFVHPVVGIHVRRTDHGREAPFRELKEYMVHVEKWWEDEKIPDSQKRIYLATDEPKVLEEAKRDYKNIEWLNYEYNDKASGETKEYLDQGRSSMDGFYSLFADWHFLSRVDFMVGTSSSQVGRMAYELMQNYHADASKNFISLDDPWYFP